MILRFALCVLAATKVARGARGPPTLRHVEPLEFLLEIFTHAL
jgi:hypothetical protein